MTGRIWLSCRPDIESPIWQLNAHHHPYQFGSPQGIPRAVRMNYAERSSVPGVHNLQHIQDFPATRLALHDLIWARAQNTDDQLPDGHLK